MTGSWKERKGVALGLTVLALCVWGAVGHAVWAGLQAPEEEEMFVSAASVDRGVSGQPLPVARASHVYAGDFRDPFAPQLAPDLPDPVEGSEEEPEETLEPEVAEPALPSVRLLGIVGETAMVAVNGYTQLVREGDFIEAGRVSRILANAIVLDFEGIEMQFNLEDN